MSKKTKESQTNAVGLIALTDPTSPVTEQYRTIRTNIQFASSIDRRLQTIVTTSSGPGEGKSITSANLAVVFAKAGQRVLLVDADMRKPTVHKTFQIGNSEGLSTLLSTSKDLMNLIQSSIVDNLSVLTSGPKPPNPSELLGSSRMEQLTEEMRKYFDIVIFDMPPIVTVTDAQIMASRTDGTILIIREKVTNKDSVQKAKELLKLVNARVLGVVYNGATQTKDQAYYY